MLKPVVGCFLSGFLLTVALSATTEAPDSAEQQRILDKVRQYAARYLDNLPNFVCARVTEQFEAGRSPKIGDNSTLSPPRLIFNQGKENQTLELVNGKPFDLDAISAPAGNSGEFGGLVSNSFGCEYLRPDQLEPLGRFAWSSRWRFLNTWWMKHSTLSVGVDGFERIVPYRGLIYADPETGELWRITNAALRYPGDV